MGTQFSGDLCDLSFYMLLERYILTEECVRKRGMWVTYRDDVFIVSSDVEGLAAYFALSPLFPLIGVWTYVTPRSCVPVGFLLSGLSCWSALWRTLLLIVLLYSHVSPAFVWPSRRPSFLDAGTFRFRTCDSQFFLRRP